MKFRVEAKSDFGRNASLTYPLEYWAIGYDIPFLKEVARADTKERAEEIVRLLNDAAAVASYDAVVNHFTIPAPIPPIPASKWWEIWK